eukprot:COSAG02_NODE_848_length_16553_cov_21.228577_10_plen_53_part_00
MINFTVSLLTRLLDTHASQCQMFAKAGHDAEEVDVMHKDSVKKKAVRTMQEA